MGAKSESELTRGVSVSILRYVRRSRRKITMLFTDIEDSTKYWAKHGDLQGRLMVDLHNRLAFPVIHHFGGKIIKTIGDSIMASFKRPDNAVKAAMGIQQILAQARSTDRTFTLKVRIGIHTGLAIVEDNDVFGDVVNVAARVESQAKGNEILISEATEKEVRNIEFGLVSAGRFQPKGKSGMLSVYRCPWEDFESVIEGVRPGSYVPLNTRRRTLLGLALLGFLGVVGFLYLEYARYLLGDAPELPRYVLNPVRLVAEHEKLAIGCGGFLVAVLAWYLLRLKAVSHWVLRAITGGVAFCGGLLVVLAVTHFVPPVGRLLPQENLLASKHQFVSVLVDDTKLFEHPSVDASVAEVVPAGMVFLQLETAKRDGLAWTRVHLGDDRSAWVQKVTPAVVGAPEMRVTAVERFRLRWNDLAGLIAGLVGFLWGFFNPRIRPT